ncbi:MAG: dihydrolipoyl dehydrogenase [Bacteroidetes Order II. Incertae sedis bacterium]|nr:dihydrolipoyl dehydrogenase [Bacteroidetes Order II. bacterium]
MAQNKYDVVVIGSGPGGYECAIRASQLGLKTAIIEKNKLGGVCLNVGCIPTKALLKSAEVLDYTKHMADFGIEFSGTIGINFPKVIARSRGVADKMNKGVEFLMKKNKIDVLYGHGTIEAVGKVSIAPAVNMDGKEQGTVQAIEAAHIIIATGARTRILPNLPIDGKKIIGSTEALIQTEQPKKLLIVGAGAIGVEFAYFYNQMGTEVTIVEMMDRLVPIEDAEVSKELERNFKKQGIGILTGSVVESVDTTSGAGCKVHVKTKKGVEVLEVDQVLSAVGVQPNTENLGLEKLGIQMDRGWIVARRDDASYATNVPGIYAIGDINGPPWLAHAASHEGVLCVEKIAGHHPEAFDYGNVPGCTYCQPQIASVGFTEAKAKEAGYEVKVGKFPFTASGKASAIGHNEGFVKIIFDAKYGEILGCHIIGVDATEMIAEIVTARKAEATYHEVQEAVHPHPTLSEAIMEAARAAYGHAINM